MSNFFIVNKGKKKDNRGNGGKGLQTKNEHRQLILKGDHSFLLPGAGG